MTNECWICYDSNKDEKLISPCKCSGSLKYVHKSCLETWLQYEKDSQCKICKTNYQIKRDNKQNLYYSLLKNRNP